MVRLKLVALEPLSGLSQQSIDCRILYSSRPVSLLNPSKSSQGLHDPLSNDRSQDRSDPPESRLTESAVSNPMNGRGSY